MSFAAAACYNFFFLPPYGTLTLSDPQDWITLIAFLTVGVVGARLSQRARDEAVARAEAVEEIARSEAAKENERLRTLILDSITHELRTPLTSIKGAATTLLSNEKGVSEADRRELLTIVDEESDRLNRLISQAVEMAELASNKVRLRVDLFSVADLIAQTREACAWVVKTHPMSAHVEAELDMQGDAELLRKALCNLVENAAKYSPANAGIAISASRVGKNVLLSVADRGVGVAPEEQTKIFDRLYRVRAGTAKVSGTGMGLAITRAIAEAHGGKLSMVSQVGEGSVFTMTLPG